MRARGLWDCGGLQKPRPCPHEAIESARPSQSGERNTSPSQNAVHWRRKRSWETPWPIPEITFRSSAAVILRKLCTTFKVSVHKDESHGFFAAGFKSYCMTSDRAGWRALIHNINQDSKIWLHLPALHLIRDFACQCLGWL